MDSWLVGCLAPGPSSSNEEKAERGRVRTSKNNATCQRGIYHRPRLIPTWIQVELGLRFWLEPSRNHVEKTPLASVVPVDKSVGVKILGIPKLDS